MTQHVLVPQNEKRPATQKSTNHNRRPPTSQPTLYNPTHISVLAMLLFVQQIYASSSRTTTASIKSLTNASHRRRTETVQNPINQPSRETTTVPSDPEATLCAAESIVFPVYPNAPPEMANSQSAAETTTAPSRRPSLYTIALKQRERNPLPHPTEQSLHWTHFSQYRSQLFGSFL